MANCVPDVDSDGGVLILSIICFCVTKRSGFCVPDDDFDGDVDEAVLSVRHDGDDITSLELINLAVGWDLKEHE